MRLIIRAARCLAAVALALALTAPPASAQYQPSSSSQPATGEKYYVEFGAGWWDPSPAMTVSSESLGIIGSEIDAVNDLGFQKTGFKEFRLVLRPAKKHKFRFDYIPISFAAESTLDRTIVFNGQAYQAGLPVNSTMDWKVFQLGYEYDFLYRNWWYAGLIVEAKYTSVTIRLQSPIDDEYASVRAPIPTAGGVFRIYPVANISITGELTGFKLPTSVDSQDRYDGKYIDGNLYGTVNLTNNFGVQVGYRSLTVSYRVKLDTGDFVLRGPYIMGVARF
jgi:hypothetical protein